jgi:pyruvate formate lyase activating enzyme
MQCDSKVCIEKCNYDALLLSGRKISSQELVEIIALDLPFYRNSGGGVTFSGGEPLMQPSFLLDVLKKCKVLEIHTAIETCGWADQKALQQVLPYTDLFLFDLKIIDTSLHLSFTGKPVEPVLENLSFLASFNAKIIIRFPLIPGITDTPQNLKDVADVMLKNNLKQICLEPYHTLGKEKYEEHGMIYQLDNVDIYSQQQIKTVENLFLKWGFICEVV